MGTQDTAAVAALIVAILAMVIATFQCLQQYLSTGQLIRMCDGVVYGKMPGQGRRVWELRQFRFRVVYEIPMIELRATLWGDDMRESEGSHLGVPDLRIEVKTQKRLLTEALQGSKMMSGRKQGCYSAVPGEAPWVSFCRAVQFTTGNDLFYQLVEGDADRCPSDLCVVPMQVSMRNIVAMALMAGMRCTDASFENKSLSMDGANGTITSSWHSILGAIIRFTPKGVSEPQGLRIGDGSVHPMWMARMLDVVVVAGRSYSLRERKFYELYEGYNVVTSSRDISLAKAPPWSTLSKASAFSTDIRKRRPSHSIESTRLGTSAVTSGMHGHLSDMGDSTCDSNDQERDGMNSSDQDGDWSFVSDDKYHSHSLAIDRTSDIQRPMPLQASQRPLLQRLGGSLHDFLRPQMAGARSVQSNPYNIDVEECRNSEGEKSQPIDFNQRQNQIRLPTFAAGLMGRKLLDGIALQNYIIEKKKILATPPQNGPLYLTWRKSHEDVVMANTASDRAFKQPSRWQDAHMDKQRERASIYLNQWRGIVRSRSRAREGFNLDDEWELLSRFSMFARSNADDTTRPNTSSTLDGRARSWNTNVAGRAGYGADAGYVSEQRGRIRDDRSLDYSLRRGHRSVSPTRFSSPRPRSRRRTSSPSYSTSAITYGNTPILAIEAAPDRDPEVQHRLVEDQEALEPSSIVFKDESINEPLVFTSKPMFKRNDFEDLLRLPKELKFANSNASIAPGGENFISSRTATGITLEPPDPRPHSPPVRNEDVGLTTRPKKSILKSPRDKFPEDEDPIREGVAPTKHETKKEIPAGAKWTKINRRVVSPEALERMKERYEGREDFVVVLRVLTKEEVQTLADLTQEIRAIRDRNESDSSETDLKYSDQDNSQQQTSQSPHRVARRRSNIPRKSIPSPNRGRPPPGGWSTESTIDLPHNIPFTNSPNRISASSSEDDESSPGLDGRKRYHSSSSASTRRRRRARRGSSDQRSYHDHRSSYDRSKPSSFDDQMQLVRKMNISRANDRYRERDPSRGSVGPTYDIPKNIFEGKGQVNWSWICQADVLPGFFATPWKDIFSESVCLGAISTILEIIQYFTTPTSLCFVEKHPYCEAWIKRGLSTYPSYAINAMGGIIVSGLYRRARFACLDSTIPPIELRCSYTHQVSGSRGSMESAPVVLTQLAELAFLDSWLAFCGRLPEICNGRNDLLRRMPALIQVFMSEYDYELGTLDRSAEEGGVQVIQELAEIILEGWDEEGFSEAEMLFTAVAVLRCAKMALCVCKGPGTSKLMDILREDVQVHMV